MFERYLAEALASQFSHIVSNFDKDKVKISVWSGEVVLRDLTLKEDALQQLSQKAKANAKLNANKNQSSSSDDDDGADDNDDDNNSTDPSNSESDTIPFKISHGHIGTFELHIPWQIFRSAQQNKTSSSLVRPSGDEKEDGKVSAASTSCSLVLSDVNILISPGIPRTAVAKDGSGNGNGSGSGTDAKNNSQDEGAEGENLLQSRIDKERLVQGILDMALFRKNIEQVADLYSSSDLSMKATKAADSNEKKDKSFVKNLVENILSSITVTVRNIHIRYEDPGDCLGFDTRNRSAGGKRRVQHRPPFAVGISLEEFQLVSAEFGAESDDELYSIPIVNSGEAQEQEGSSEDSPQDEAREDENMFSIQHKLAAAKNLSIYWDSDLSSKDLIHDVVPKIMRRKRRRERRRIHRVGEGLCDSSDSSDDEFEDCASGGGASPTLPRSGWNSFDEEMADHSDQDSEGDIETHYEIFSSMLHDALVSRDKQRTYIVQPISPSLHCSIVSPRVSSEHDQNKEAYIIPPSRAILKLPPSKLNITKDTLEDVAYLRRSLAQRNEDKRNIVTRKIYERLTKARPDVSPKENPRAWWHYAFEAVTTLSHMQRESATKAPSNPNRRQGWRGLVECLKLRNRYVSTYEALLQIGSNEHEKEELNEKLCRIEDDLSQEEIAAFRVNLVLTDLSAVRVRKLSVLEHSKHEEMQTSKWKKWLWGDPSQSIDNKDAYEKDPKILLDQRDLLSWRYREFVYAEMMAALDHEGDLSYDVLFPPESGAQLNSGLSLFKRDTESRSKLDMAIICPEIVLQVDDIISDRNYSERRATKQRLTRNTKVPRKRLPVLQLRCAIVQKVCFRHDSAWDTTTTFASLELLDMVENTYGVEECPKLITRKRSWIDRVASTIPDDVFDKPVRVGDQNHFHGGTIFVKKRCDVTSVSVIVSPMEIVYSPDSVQAMSKVLSTTRTSELSGDYQKFKHMVSNWKNKKKQRLMEVLSQREKGVDININISAPVFLMHDKTSNGTLVLDLGRLSFKNGEETVRTEDPNGFDDSWNLSLQNIQVLCMPSPCGVSPPLYKLVHYDKVCHLVEPFSLDFIVHTKIGSDHDDDTDGFVSQIQIDATLPRLVFNMNSSSVRLVHRLSEYRDIRKSKTKKRDDEMDDDGTLDRVPYPSSFAMPSNAEVIKKKSAINVDFSAPLIVLRLANDIDGRDSCNAVEGKQQTQIAELVVSGIAGNVNRTTSGTMESTTFTSKLNSLYAKDSYQRAGQSFDLLLSSRESETGELPQGLSSSNQMLNIDGVPIQDSDLVKVHYHDDTDKRVGKSDKKLSIEFHELYVEWNAETIAAIQKALRLSREEKSFFLELRTEKVPLVPEQSPIIGDLSPFDLGRASSLDESVAFFDAVEEHPTETFSEVEEDVFLSEMSSNDEFSFHELPMESKMPPLVKRAMEAIAVNDMSLDYAGKTDPLPHESPTRRRRPLPILSVTFHLSKLRVSFNKESRLRRLITAEMNETVVQYRTKPFGGRKIVIRVGNLTLCDPSRLDGSTLYNEILGLQNNSTSSGSMLEITQESFPRDESNLFEGDNELLSGPDVIHDKEQQSLCIDKRNRKIRGCDTFLTMHFSPMRFVYLQQLWLEIVDYFFEGIMGNEVWGRERPVVDGAIEESQQRIEDQILSQRNSTGTLDSDLPWADAEGARFMKFNIILDAPIIILPVEYRSPQHLCLAANQIQFSNEFHGQVETLNRPEKGVAQYVQWFNNCSVEFDGLRLSSWCGSQLNINEDPKLGLKESERNSIPMKIMVKWPVGQTAFTIVPKWDFQCSIDQIRLLFRKNDYALFQHILWNNIGEESRHLDEWNALQNLPLDDLIALKKKIMVHFGYDKKDGEPTTLHLKIDVSSIIIHFCLDENNHVADLEGSQLRWSLRRVKDRISRQLLTFDSIHLTQTSGNNEWARCKTLLFPLKEVISQAQQTSPQLVYTSISRPSGDAVKVLTVSNACIHFVYPAWMFVKGYFRDLPEPDVMDKEEVLSSVQILDRWYRIKKGTVQSEDGYEDNTINQDFNKPDQQKNEPKPKAEYQFRVVLESPRIVLVDDSSFGSSTDGRAVTLNLGHLDFLYVNDPVEEVIKKTIFLHDLELFTGSTEEMTSKTIQSQENSLLYPLSAGAGISAWYDGDEVVSSEKWVSSDVISARAAYTDITLSIDVFLKNLLDYRHISAATPASPKTTRPAENIHVKESVSFACGGFDLLVIDDSERHFLTAQELIQVSIGGILYKSSGSGGDNAISTMKLQLNSVQLTDCLQPTHSPFRVVAIGKNFEASEIDSSSDLKSNQRSRWLGLNRTLFKDFMSWEKYSMAAAEWGFSASSAMVKRYYISSKSRMMPPFDKSNLIDLKHTKQADGQNIYTCKIRSIVLQWNPSMAIALQRFLGRLRKEAKEKYLVKQLSDKKNDQSEEMSLREDDEQRNFQGLEMEVEMESLTLCLNKEHQHRRLLQITMSKSVICFQRDNYTRLNVHGYVGGFNAWDSDGNREGQMSICHENRLVVGVLHNPADDDFSASSDDDSDDSDSFSRRLLSFNFYSQPNDKLNDLCDNISSLEVPDWVRVQVGEDCAIETIDDCLSLTLATVRFNHIKERTKELMDYLSNGLPGKGMGATSRAAKGFITKKIKTRSFANLSINSPQLFLPRNRGTEEGVIVCLGDVKLTSWFDEASLEDSTSLSCEDVTQMRIPVYKQVPLTPRINNKIQVKYWWRVLSVSILGLGWRVNQEKAESTSSSLKIENPMNIYLQIRKPPNHQSQSLPLIVRCRLTAIELVLSYSEYLLMNAVLEENLMKKVDKKLWDDMEDNNYFDETADDKMKTVQYSKNARIVRYGEKSKRHSNDSTAGTDAGKNNVSDPSTSMDVKLSLDGLALTLHRDDIAPGMPHELCYDIVCLDINDVLLTMTANTDKSNSASIEFNSVSLLDVGDTGRIAREQYQVREGLHKEGSPQKILTRQPSVFSVIAEGYDTSESCNDLMMGVPKEPLLIINVEKKSSATLDLDSTLEFNSENTKLTSVRVTLNKMNINPLIKPLGEIADFMSGAWMSIEDDVLSTSGSEANTHNTKSSLGNESSPNVESSPLSQNKSERTISAIHVTIVTNYPRIFLVADETDPTARALVLRGKTVVNATLVREIEGGEDKSKLLSIEGHLGSLESYINPDPKALLERKSWARKFDFEEDEPCEPISSIENSCLGIALIEPVTAAFNFRQLKRKNFPTIRESFMSMEPVSTTFSFEDIRLIEVVLTRWRIERELKKARRNGLEAAASKDIKKQDSQLQRSMDDTDDTFSIPPPPPPFDGTPDKNQAILQSDSLEAQSNTSMCGSSILSCMPESPISFWSSRSAKTKDIIPSGLAKTSKGNEYSIRFTKQKLGLVLRRNGAVVVVEKILETELLNKIKPGDELLTIGARAIAGMPFQSVLACLREAERPMLIYFRPAHTERPRQTRLYEIAFEEPFKSSPDCDETPHKEESYFFSLSNSSDTCEEEEDKLKLSEAPSKIHSTSTISLKKGADHGMTFEKSCCGDVAIVTRINEATFLNARTNEESKRSTYVPQPGTAIIAINDFEVTNIKAINFLKPSPTRLENGDNTYTITFLDASSEDWGAVDSINIVISGIKVTLIDDINGRDMPLLRGSFETIAVKVERGLGLDCNSIIVASPSLLSRQENQEGSECRVKSDSTEIITKVYGNAETRIDYYNARIAVWEPFLEPSYLSIEVEYQKGNNLIALSRPGSFSIALSDYQALPDSTTVKQPYVCLNLTDAAADILFSAFHEWKLWRKSLDTQSPNESNFSQRPPDWHLQSTKQVSLGLEKLQLDEDHLSMKELHPPEITVENSRQNQGAVQNAAQAALIFARRRGAESQKTGGSKPFIFRNNTGMTVSFSPEIKSNFSTQDVDYSDSISDIDLDIDGCVETSATVVKDGDEARFSLENEHEALYNSNKVRKYDGNFPHLSVNFHSPVDGVEAGILQHMSVVKIGDTMKRLTIKKNSPENDGESASTLVVWSVALENNRRIITLSSAVRIRSQDCSVPIEVGVRHSTSDEYDDEIESVGLSSFNSTFFLPLWIELTFLPAEIFIRPSSRSNCYRWSKQSIMHLRNAGTIGSGSPELWTWNIIDYESKISCELDSNVDKRLLPVELSYSCTYEGARLFNDTSEESTSFDRIGESLKCIDICANLSIRNVLPTGLEWEVTADDVTKYRPPKCLIDGSSLRERQEDVHPFINSPVEEREADSPFLLKNGHGVDIFSCNMSEQISVRMRCDYESDWSEWVAVNRPHLTEHSLETRNHGNTTDNSFEPRSRNIQSLSKTGVPLTIGLKINPRVATVWNGNKSSRTVIGYELITFGEIWIKNLTSLPIHFGVPSIQVTIPSIDGMSTSRIAAAEAALTELSSILEFGDKEHFLTKVEDESKDVVLLPQQQCDIVVEELFEYVEMRNGKEQKKWWAGEQNGSKRPDLTHLKSLGSFWQWKDKNWIIDTSGGCEATHKGWESCMNLAGGKMRNFTDGRNFDPSHRFRRRRWYRRKEKIRRHVDHNAHGVSGNEIASFHQSIYDVSSQGRKQRINEDDNGTNFLDVRPEEDESLKVCFKVDDGFWSVPALIPSKGSSHGIFRIEASRWPDMPRLSRARIKPFDASGNNLTMTAEGMPNVSFDQGCSSPACYDISYKVSSIAGQWGEYSRLLTLFPRYYIRNDSEQWYIDVKQVGASDSTSIRMKPGSCHPFYWADIALPELVCMRPVNKNEKQKHPCHAWSGGFDITILGLIPLRIKESSAAAKKNNRVNVARALVELRTGTGGTGITVSLKDEHNNGEDSLFRIENETPFPIWFAQDGLLANPNKDMTRKDPIFSGSKVILPMEKMSYGLEIPFRQGKYSGRKPLSFDELMRLRVGLAPLKTRDGIETTKVIALSRVEANTRLKPAKLRSFFDDDTIADLMCLNVQGVVSADGPTRVLKFTLIERELTATSVLKNSVRMHTSGAFDKSQHSPELLQIVHNAANKSLASLRLNLLPQYKPGISTDKCSNQLTSRGILTKEKDCNYSFRASFSGFVLSLIDNVPSEIAVIALRKVDAMAEWNASRTKESTGAISIGWMQIDNHCPNAPYPVALCPAKNRDDVDDDGNEIQRPFLTIGFVRAPHHTSDVTCFNGVTIAACDISLANDLAFIVRIQYYLLNISDHMDRYKDDTGNETTRKEIWSFPDLKSNFALPIFLAGEKTTISSKSMYFEGLTIMPFTVKLSVAPAVALTSAQAALEGPEAGAIHAAVRKGDLLIGSDAEGVLGVKIGSKNRTALAVIRGIFKSILVDSLLRCDDVSMNFSGLAIRNHLATMPQLRMFVFHHYLSLLKSNMPAVLGSLAAFGNPVGLIRGFGDGVTDFVSEPVKGFKRSIEELDPSYVMDGVARGTGSLARHTVGGIVDSASLLTETFSKNMAVLTLDRKYAQRRDRFKAMPGTNTTFVGGVESGMGKLFRGVAEGVIGVIRAPMRGAEKRGVEGFAKGVGKGLLGLIVKPVIGISDAATDVMIGVKGTLEKDSEHGVSQIQQIRPRRAFYGRDRRLRPYVFVDAISAAIMMRTRLAGENYLSHIDLGGRVAILSVKRFLLLGDDGETQLLIKLKNIKRIVSQHIDNDGMEWGLLIFLKSPRKNGNEVEVIGSEDEVIIAELENKIKHGMSVAGSE